MLHKPTTIGALFRGGHEYLSRHIAGSAVAIPETLSVERSRVLWSEPTNVKEVDTRELLDRFLALAAEDSDIADFAHQFGPLWLCERHQAVSYHRPIGSMLCGVRLVPDALDEDDNPIFCLPKVERIKRADSRIRFVYSEPSSAWRRLARQAGALVEAAAAVALNGTVEADTWVQLDDNVDLASKMPDGFRSYISNPSNRIAEHLNRWVMIADLTFSISGRKEGLRAGLGPSRWNGSVLALVALELVTAVTNAGGLAQCAGCKHWFWLARARPRPGERVGRHIVRGNYCRGCQERHADRNEASRRWRASEKGRAWRKKRKRKLPAHVRKPGKGTSQNG